MDQSEGLLETRTRKILSLTESIASPFSCALVRVALSREGWWPEERLPLRAVTGTAHHRMAACVGR